MDFYRNFEYYIMLKLKRKHNENMEQINNLLF